MTDETLLNNCRDKNCRLEAGVINTEVSVIHNFMKGLDDEERNKRLLGKLRGAG